MKHGFQYLISKTHTDSAGVALVEFALVVPLLLAIIFATFDLGWAVYANNTVSLAAREGARKGIISTASESTIDAHVQTIATGLNLQASDIDVNRHTDSGVDYVTVTVDYTYSPFTPFISILLSGGTITLTGKATMYVE